MSGENLAPGTLLEVHRRRGAWRDGSAGAHLTVHCPAQDHSLELEECLACPECGGLAADQAGWIECVRCRLAGAAIADA